MRWRRLCWARIQKYLTAVIQNIEVLVRYGRDPKAAGTVLGEFWRSGSNPIERFLGKIQSITCGLLVDF
jgi:hypothetical protein